VTSGAKLLERMRASPNGWSATDVDRLLQAYGFSCQHGSRHDVYGHELLAAANVRKVTVPRHRDLRAHVVRKAVTAVDLVLELGKES
jgi:hypothetical protein